nr:MAG TPA: hypothetical protein [Caudoviricetes sp.]
MIRQQLRYWLFLLTHKRPARERFNHLNERKNK